VAAACGAASGGKVDPAPGTPLATPTTAPTTTTTTTLAPLETTEAATIVGAALPRFGSTPDPAVGLAAPTLAGTSFDGSTISIEPSGKHQVVIFLAHWCPYCQGEVEDLGPYFATTPPADNVEVVTVSTGVDPFKPNYPPSEWLTPAAWPFPVLADSADGAMASAFGLNAFPFWVILDPGGTVIARNAGSLPPESVASLFQNLSQLEG